MNSTTPQVFISYAWESDDFRAAVKVLADFLRNQGIRVVTDHQFENRAPRDGWRRWMQTCVEDSDLVLVVCSPKYRASFEKRDGDQSEGFGRTWEAALITQELYESKLRNDKFIPILPDGGKLPDVPVVLRDFSNGLCFPSQNERIFKAIAEEIADPNASLPPFNRRPPGQLSADDIRLAPDQQDVYGREEEIAKVLAFLEGNESQAQVVAHLTGTGGIGKTEVCKRSLQQWLTAAPGSRTFWVGLSDGASPAECAATIARALGHPNISGLKELLPLLRPGLYYLDNLESLDSPEGNDLLRQICQQPGVRLLASSRVKLAALGKPIELDVLPLPAAITTFQKAWTGQEELSPENQQLISFIKNDLGCHALSIVLVASLGDTYPLERLIKRWKTKGTEVAKQENDSTRRGSLPISLQLTSDALDPYPGALLLWTVIALFPEGIDQTVLDWLYENNSLLTEEDLAKLIHHKVITRKGEHYTMLPPLGRFGLDESHKERAGFSWSTVKNVILPWLSRLVEAAASIASTEKALQGRGELIRYFSAVHRFLLEECAHPIQDLALLAFFNKKLINTYRFSVLLSRDILEAIRPILSHSSEYQLGYANALKKSGDLESRLSNLDAARAFYNEAIQLFKSMQSDLGRAYALQALGDLERRLGNVDPSRALFDEAIQLFKKGQDDLGRANALKALGDLESRLGKLDVARDLFNNANQLFKKVQSGLGRANTLKAIGDLERKLGNLDTARALYNDAIQLFKKVHSDLGRANALKSLGDLEVLAEKHLETEQYYLEALRLYQKEQGTVGVINTKISIVRMILKFGDTPTTSDAQAWYQKALETAKLTGSPFYIEFVKKQEKALFG